MPIPVVCSGCASRLNAPDGAAGKSVKCPKCGTAIAVKAVDEVPGFEVVEDEQPPSSPKQKSNPPAASGATRKKAAVVDEDEEEERPRKKRRARQDEDEDPPKKGTSGALIGGVIAGVLLLAGGGFAAYWFGFREKPKDIETKGETPNPEQIAKVTKNWKGFSSGEYGYKVMFPWGDPTQDSIPLVQTPPGLTRVGHATVTAYWEKVQPSYSFRVTSARFAANATAADREKAVAEISRLLDQPGLRWSDAKTVTWAGRQARETVAETNSPEGKKVRDVRRILVTEIGVYIATVHDVGDLIPKEESLFFDSFELLPRPNPQLPSPKQPEPKQPAPTLPAPPPGWVAYNDFGKRFIANVPAGGKVMAENGRLAFLTEVGKGKITGGDYHEIVFKERGITLSVRRLDFAATTTPAVRAELLAAYAQRISEPWQKESKVSKVTWFGLDATEEATEGKDVAEVRRSAVMGATGFVVAVRGTDKAAFDELKTSLFDNFLPNPNGGSVGVRLLPKGWHELISDVGMFRVEIPGPPTKADELDKLLADNKLVGELQTTVVGELVYVAGYFQYPANSTPEDKRRLREIVATAIGPGAGALPKPIVFPASPPRLVAWEEYQRRAMGTQPAYMVRFHEFDGGTHVLAARGPDALSSQDRVRFFQFFELLK